MTILQLIFGAAIVVLAAIAYIFAALINLWPFSLGPQDTRRKPTRKETRC
jgi:hypothetical protein